MNTQCQSRNAITVLQLSAMNGLRKNLKVSNPSFGASFHAPPKALNHPPALASSSTSHFGASGYAACRRVTPHTVAVITATTAASTDQRTARLFTGTPNTPNCMGMKYLPWSSSRRKVFHSSTSSRSLAYTIPKNTAACAKVSGRKPTTRSMKIAISVDTTMLRKYLGRVKPSCGASLYIPHEEVWAPASSPIRMVIAKGDLFGEAGDGEVPAE